MLGRTPARWFAGGTLWLALACGGTVLEAGQGASAGAGTSTAGRSAIDDAGGAGSSPSGVGGSDVVPSKLTPVAGAGNAVSDLTGDWVGYVENFKFSNGEDTVWLTIANEQGLSGQIHFGGAATPPPATDAEAIYPPDVVPATSTKPSLPDSPYAGARFTLLNVELSGKRLAFDIARNEVFESWCKLQTPYPWGDGYNCMPEWGYFGGPDGCAQQDPSTMAMVARSCFQLAMCTLEKVCDCKKSDCAASLGETAHFDISFEKFEANGSVAGFDDYMPKNTHNVHLERTVGDPAR